MAAGSGPGVTGVPVSPVPLVSIVMPARNHAPYVGTALRSILAQSHPRIELIVIDDGSQDATPEEIARTLAACPRRMRVEFHRQRNVGLAGTLIRALSMAQGEFVQFLASDDALFAGMTARLVAAFEAAGPGVAAIGCDGYVFDGLDRPHQPFSQQHPVPFGRNLHRELQVGNWFPAMGLLYRRDLLMREGGIDPDLVYEDWGLLLNLSRNHRILQIPDRLFLYRQHGANISRDPESMFRAHRALCARHPAMRTVRDWKQALQGGDLRGILAGITPGNLDLAARFALRQLQRRAAQRAGFGWPLPRQVGVQLAAHRQARFGRGVKLVRGGPGRIEIGAGCVIGPGAVLTSGEGDLVLEAGCRIGAGARLSAGAGLRLEAGCLVGEAAAIGGSGAGTRLGRACLVAEGAELAAGTVLGDLCAAGPGLGVAGTHPAGTWLLEPSPSAEERIAVAAPPHP